MPVFPTFPGILFLFFSLYVTVVYQPHRLRSLIYISVKMCLVIFPCFCLSIFIAVDHSISNLSFNLYFVSIPTRPSISSSIDRSIYISTFSVIQIRLSVYVSIYLSVCLSTYLFIILQTKDIPTCSSVYPTFHLYIYLFTFLSIFLSQLSSYNSNRCRVLVFIKFINFSISLSFYLANHISLYLTVCLYLTVYLHISLLYLSLSPSSLSPKYVYLSIHPSITQTIHPQWFPCPTRSLPQV